MFRELSCNKILQFRKSNVAVMTILRNQTRDLALASMARDDPPASSMAAAMRGKVGLEFET